MSKNLVKSYFLNRENSDARIIDTNELVAKRLERIRYVMPEAKLPSSEFEQVDMFENAPVADPLDALSTDFSDVGFENTGMEGLVATQTPKEPEYEGPSPEELLAQARDEIEAMKAEAKQDIEAEKQRVYAEAKSQGYAEGEQEAMRQLEAMQQQLEVQKQSLIDSYEEQVDMLEPKFVATLTDIYEKIFDIDLQDKKPLVVNMLRNTMKRLDGCKNYMVHVSSQDYSYVKEHKEELLTESASENAVVDIVEDVTMKPSECTVETVNGIYDCGLGTQLLELKKKLLLLSYEGKD